MYDYGARNYDPALGRFHNMDRFSEKYEKLSPYSYTMNNPVFFVDINGDSISVAGKYRGDINKILEQSFGANSSKFSYSKKGMLMFNGKASDLSKDERKAFKELNKLMSSSNTFEVLIEENINFTDKNGNEQSVNTGSDGSKGDTAVYDTSTKDGNGILGLNPNPSSIKVNVIDVKYDENGNQIPANYSDMLLNGGRGPERTFTLYENFWHGVGHLIGGAGNLGNAMEVENLGGAIHKNVSTDASGNKTYTPATITTKNFNLDHPKK